MMVAQCRSSPAAAALRRVFFPSSSNISGLASRWQPRPVFSRGGLSRQLARRHGPHGQSRRGMASRPGSDDLWNDILSPAKGPARPDRAGGVGPGYGYGYGYGHGHGHGPQQKSDRQGAYDPWGAVSRTAQGGGVINARNLNRDSAYGKAPVTGSGFPAVTGSGFPAAAGTSFPAANRPARGAPAPRSAEPEGPKLGLDEIYKLLLSKDRTLPTHNPQGNVNSPGDAAMLESFSRAFASAIPPRPTARSEGRPGSAWLSKWKDDGQTARELDEPDQDTGAEEIDLRSLEEKMQARKRSERTRFTGDKPRNEDILSRRLVHIRFDQGPAAGALSRPCPIADLLRVLDRKKYAVELVNEKATLEKQEELKEKAAEQRIKQLQALEPGAQPAQQELEPGAQQAQQQQQQQQQQEVDGVNEPLGVKWMGEHPICRIVDLGEEAMMVKQRMKEENLRKRKAKKAEIDKEMEINWGIEPHDLDLRLRRLREFLEKGFKVEIKLVNKAAKKKGRGATNKRASTEEEAQEMLDRLHATRKSVSGSKEPIPAEGALLGAYRLQFQGPKVKKVKRVRKKGADGKMKTVLEEVDEEEEEEDEEEDQGGKEEEDRGGPNDRDEEPGRAAREEAREWMAQRRVARAQKMMH